MIGHPHDHLLTAIRTLQYSTQIKGTSTELFREYDESLDGLDQWIKTVCTIFCINEPVSARDQAAILNDICAILLKTLDLPASLVGQDNLDEKAQQIIRISEHAINRTKIKKSLLSTFHKDVLIVNAETARGEWIAAHSKWFIPRYFGRQSVMKPFKALAVPGKFDKTRMESYFDDIIEFQQEQKFIESNYGFLSSVLGPGWQDGDGIWEEIIQVCNTVLRLNELLTVILADPIKSGICRKALSGKLTEGFKSFLFINKNSLQRYQTAFARFLDVEKRLNELLDIDFDTLGTTDDDFIENARTHCNDWKTGIESLRDWVGWNQTKNKAISQGLLDLVNQYEKGNIENKDVLVFLLKSLYRSFADYIIAQDKSLSDFNGKLFDEKIRKFRQLNQHFEQLTKDEMYAKLAARIPSFTREAALSSEIGILQRNIRNNGRGISIRKLFDTIPTLLTRICPCMLMSPISVAQYIDVNNFKFDLIVFDEASQMPTCEAVGAIARGNHMIVVGDPKQMPPTSFFTSNNIDEENLEKEDLESILDDCLALSLPSKHLLWHYRSKHESLITFSNSQYYENSLLTFPSPDDLTTKVKFVSVGGYYDRGKTRQNSFEARAVVDEIIQRLSDPLLSKKSIGVVTFSSVQQTLVDDLLNEAFMLRPDLELIATETHEPIFIKNLENVQGDERDVILFSVGYGPDKEGKVNLNFGPLNREGGWHRLNVAVSRARYEMKVFSTLKADQIDITRTAARGVLSLKAFLDFAEKGRGSMIVANGNGKPTNSGIVDHIAKKLKENGFNVNTNIGCSGFKIDIGITNPSNPTEYILGILCDGHSYKESKTAKDREIVQSEVLRLLGWQIHKVWSCDWWDNPEKILQEIGLVIKNIKPGEQAPNVPENNNPGIKNSHPRQEPQKVIIIPKPPVSRYKSDYKVCTLKVRNPVPQPDLFLQDYNKKYLIEDIQAVLNVEAPISKELLCRRVLAAWSMVRIGSRIEAWFDVIFAQMNIKHTDKGTRFFWKADQQPEDYAHYRISNNEAEKREASDIPPEEVSNAIREILENQISLNRDELVKEVARIFGFGRTGTYVESAMLSGIEKSVKRGFARVEAERVYLVE